MSEHTKEPWIRSYHANGVNFIYSEGRDVHIATCHGGGDETANARRIVACVNSCEGIDTENLEMIGRMFAEKKLASTPLHIIDKVEAENKRLREALKCAYAVLHDTKDDWRVVGGVECIQYIRVENAFRVARAALGKE